MCNFTFDDHPQVVGPIIQQLEEGQVENQVVGLEKRMRLKVNVGPGTSPEKLIFRGD